MTEYKAISDHFRQVDPILSVHFERMPERILTANSGPQTYFAKLCQDIVAQQLGMKAADAIIGRFLDLFPDRNPTPNLVLAKEESVYREIGTSWAKARYIRALAEAVINRDVNFELFPTLGDEEIVADLIKVKGIGRWTAEMFLIFTLGRLDVFSAGDLGLKNAMIKLYGKEVLEKEALAKKVETWSPYRSYACLALWFSLDNR
jgi:DNA-3-methyladenine glycosylase II